MDTATINCSKCGSSNFFTASDTVVRCQYCGANIFIDMQPLASQPSQPRPIINLSADTDVLDSQAADYTLATSSQRFVNRLIDLFISYMLLFVIMILGIENMPTSLFMILIFFTVPAYYILLEGSTGKTIGKYVTGTRAIQENGTSLGYGKAFIRTICRLIPLETFSLFFNEGVCWHDTIPGTRVIKDK